MPLTHPSRAQAALLTLLAGAVVEFGISMAWKVVPLDRVPQFAFTLVSALGILAGLAALGAMALYASALERPALAWAATGALGLDVAMTAALALVPATEPNVLLLAANAVTVVALPLALVAAAQPLREESMTPLLLGALAAVLQVLLSGFTVSRSLHWVPSIKDTEWVKLMAAVLSLGARGAAVAAFGSAWVVSLRPGPPVEPRP